MNIIAKGRPRESGSINQVFKWLKKERTDEELTFDVGKTRRATLEKLLIICGKVGKSNIELYENKAKELGADFVFEDGSSWVFTRKTIQHNFEKNKHLGILLIGDNKELPATQIGYQGSYAWTDFFFQDVDGDGIPDTPVGRVYGPPETVQYHIDPQIIDSNIAVVFDSQPGRSSRHVEGLAALGFDVEVLKKYNKADVKLLQVSEFILQFSDGVFTSRIHGTPEQWASHNSVILSYQQAESIKFVGYPVVYSEACSTAQDGPLLKAFLKQGAIYIGATLDTMNNTRPYDDWRDCPYCDGYKFGLLDLLDSYPHIGEVKVTVDRSIFERLDVKYKTEIEQLEKGESNEIQYDEVVSTIEWMLFGNPLRRTTVGPDADFTPGRLTVDT
jgi:hypothetical protein